MNHTLMGMETEFGFTPLKPSGAALPHEDWLLRLIETVRQARACLTGRGPQDIYLGSGARLYADCGHPEWATPEVSSPEEAVRYNRAGEATLVTAAAELERSSESLGRVILFKCNVDYAAGTTWGAHENYLYKARPLDQRRARDELPSKIIPHLVSRVVFTGAGGLDPSSRGIAFSLSPRVRFLTATISNRYAVFNTKDEPHAARGYRRLHVVAGESLCSHVADYLRLGTTALILKLCEAGLSPAAGLQLQDPLKAMAAYTEDPFCSARAPCADGTRLSALEIQHRYLEHAESRLDAPFMPPWSEEVCCRWRDVLEALESGCQTLVSVLDWPIKLALFKERARQHGFDWPAVTAWTRAEECLVANPGPMQPFPRSREALIKMLRRAACPADALDAIVDQLASRGWSPSELRQVHRSLRAELCEIDIRYGQLVPQGLFDTLDRLGVLDHRIVSDEQIALAIDAPPTEGRSRVRGEQIQRLRAETTEARCDWSKIVDPARHRELDLSDPLLDLPPPWRDIYHSPDLDQMLDRNFRLEWMQRRRAES